MSSFMSIPLVPDPMSDTMLCGRNLARREECTVFVLVKRRRRRPPVSISTHQRCAGAVYQSTTSGKTKAFTRPMLERVRIGDQRRARSKEGVGGAWGDGVRISG